MIANISKHGHGPGQVEKLAITSQPCGDCRQWMNEWAYHRDPNHITVIFQIDGKIIRIKNPHLLPFSFGPGDLGIQRLCYPATDSPPK